MNYFIARSKAKKMSNIIKDVCHVIKVKSKVKWYLVGSWFRFENVSQDYIDFKDYKGKIYFSTKIRKDG